MMRWTLRTRLPVVAAVYLAALAVVHFTCVLAGMSVGRTYRDFWMLRVLRNGQVRLVLNEQGGVEPQAYDSQFHPLGATTLSGYPEAADLVTVQGPPWRGIYSWCLAYPYFYSTGNEYFIEAKEAPDSDRLWFWLPEERVFAAYSTRSHRLVGRLGFDGFHSKRPAEPFGVEPGSLMNLWWRVRYTTWLVLPQRDRASMVHLLDGSVRTLAKAPGGFSGAAIIPTYHYLDKGPLNKQMHIFLRAGAALECYDFAGSRTASVALTARERAARVLQVARADDGTLVLVASKGETDLDGTSIRRVAPDGKTLTEHVLKVPQALRFPPWPAEIAHRLTAVAAPLWLAAEPVMSSLGTSVTRTWSLLAGIAVGLICAVVIAVKARRKVAWTLFALVGGLPAVAAYFATAHEPLPSATAPAPPPEGVRILEAMD